MSVSRLDGRQLEAVAVDRNAVVSAGAGSGKTTVLARRYLRLVREGRARIDRILTLTFTRKAAAEMYDRIYRLLSAHASEADIRAQLSTFDRARISTLDSFCSSIARNWSQRYGVPNVFTMDEVESGRQAEDTALEFLLRHHGDPALAELIYRNGFETVWKDFFVSLAERYLSVARVRDFTRMWERQRELLEETVRVRVNDVSRISRGILEIGADAGKTVAAAHETARMLLDLEGITREGRYTEAEELLETVPGIRMPGSVSKPELLVFKELLSDLREALAAIRSATAVLAESPMYERLFALCGEFQDICLEGKRRSGILMFHDVVDMAIRILEENVELRRYYKHRFTYIMIDEFQDNNLQQKQLLYLLAERPGAETEGIPGPESLEEGKLFFVGDEKQSIYRFRGADVSVFKGLHGELAANGGVSISLSRNYRSHPALIAFFNRVFEQVMGEAKEGYEAGFAPLEDRGSEGGPAPLIRILYAPHRPDGGEGSLHPDDAEAYRIAELVRDAVDRGTLLIPSPDGPRPVRYKDFALLMRSGGNQIRFERMFRLFGVPYVTQNVRALFLDAPVNDMYAFLQLTVYPDDRTAYAAVLRSPFAGLSDSEVVRILLSGDLPFARDPGDLAGFAEEDRRKYAVAKTHYEFLLEKADRVPISELVFHLWHTFGYRYFMLRDTANHPFLEYFDYFRALASEADERGSCLAVFLDFVRENLGRYEKLDDLSVLKESADGIQIMTIHKAKGLEFPVVILANSGNRGSASDGGSLYYLSEEYGLTMNAAPPVSPGSRRVRYNHFYDRAKAEDESKELAESKRLLYVALTRAESHLVISGCHNAGNKKKEGVLLNMLLRALGWDGSSPVLEAEGLREFIEEIKPVPEDAVNRRIHRVARDPAEAAADYAGAPEISIAVRDEDLAVTELNRRFLETRARGAERVLPPLEIDPLLEQYGLHDLFGTLTHLVIQLGLEGIEPDASDHRFTRLRGDLGREVPAGVFDSLLSCAARLGKGFFSSSLGARALAAPSRETECGFLLRLNGRNIRGQIDLLFETADRAVIVDFKTDTAVREGEYELQLQLYREAVREWTDKPVTCRLFYLRDGSMIEVPEIEVPGIVALSPVSRRDPPEPPPLPGSRYSPVRR